MPHLDWTDHTDHTDGPYTDWDDYDDEDCYHEDWEDHNDGHTDWDDHCNDAYLDWDDHQNWDDGFWADHDDAGAHTDWTDHGDTPYIDWDDVAGAHQDWTDYTDSGGDPHTDWTDHNDEGTAHSDWTDVHSDIVDWTDHHDDPGVHTDHTDNHSDHTDWTDAHSDWDDHSNVPHLDHTDSHSDHDDWTDAHSDWYDHANVPIPHQDWNDHNNTGSPHDDWDDHGDVAHSDSHTDHNDHNDTGDPHTDWTDHGDTAHADHSDAHIDWDDYSDWTDAAGPHSDWTDLPHDDWDDHGNWTDAHTDWGDGSHSDWSDGAWTDHQDEAHANWTDTHSDWDDAAHQDWDDSSGEHQDWTDHSDDAHCDWTDHNNVAHNDWTDYSDGGGEAGKTWVTIIIEGNDISCYLISADIWRDALNGVGRWEAVIYNPAHIWGATFNPDDDVTIRINGVLMMRGYVDDVYPFLDPEGVYKEKMRINGRDYGMDLAQLYITATYENQRADDIMAAAVIAAGSEITYASPAALPATTNYDFDRTYLTDGARDLAKLVDYDFYVADDLPRTLHFFDIASMGGGVEHTAVILRSTPGTSTNNILRLEIGETLGFGIKNQIEAHAGSLNDHYTDLNAADWSWVIAGTTITDNGAGGVIPGPDAPPFLNGKASLLFRNVSGGIAIISAELDFTGTRYEYSALDLSESTTGRLNYLMHDTRNTIKTLYFLLEDGGGHVIAFYRSLWVGLVKCFNCTSQPARDEWRSVDFPLGNESGIEAIIPGAAGAQKGTWFVFGGPAGTFDWTDVVKIGFRTAVTVNDDDYFLIDGLEFPNHEVISIDQNAGSIGLYGTRMKQEYRPDIKNQIELDDYTEDEIAKYKDPAANLKITAIGETGSQYAAQSLLVGAPSSGVALWTQYRIFKLHHQVRLSPEDNPITGYDYITEYELVIYNTPVDPTRSVETYSPTESQVRRTRDQQRFRRPFTVR